MGLGVSSDVKSSRSTVLWGTVDVMVGLLGMMTAAAPLLSLRSAFDSLGFLISDDFRSIGLSYSSAFSCAKISRLSTLLL